MFRFDFTKTEYEKFVNECPFTDDEVKILEYRRRGKSVTYMAMEMALSERTIKRRIKSIHNKILKVI